MIVGGGQAGLAVGVPPSRRDRPFVILDAGSGSATPGGGAGTRSSSSRLPATRVPGLPFPAPPGSLPTKDGVADYLETYAAEFDLPVRDRRPRGASRPQRQRFRARRRRRRFEADNVVVASGAYHGQRVPAFASELDPASCSCTRPLPQPVAAAGGGVLVVGAGHSGAEIALEVAAATRPGCRAGRPASPARVGGVHGPAADAACSGSSASHVLTVRTPLGRKIRPRC